MTLAVFHKAHSQGLATFVAQANDAALTYEQNKMALKYVYDPTIVEKTFRNNTSTIQNNLKDFDEWANMNKMNLNPKKCMYMDVSFTRDPCVLEPLGLSGEDISQILLRFWVSRYQKILNGTCIFLISLNVPVAGNSCWQYKGVLACQLKIWKLYASVLFDYLMNMSS